MLAKLQVADILIFEGFNLFDKLISSWCFLPPSEQVIMKYNCSRAKTLSGAGRNQASKIVITYFCRVTVAYWLANALRELAVLGSIFDRVSWLSRFSSGYLRTFHGIRDTIYSQDASYVCKTVTNLYKTLYVQLYCVFGNCSFSVDRLIGKYVHRSSYKLLQEHI